MSGGFGGARLWLRRSTVFLGVLGLGAVVSLPDAQGASALREFNRAASAADSHIRGALSYLRSGNRDLGAIEIEESRQKWRSVIERFGAAPPDAFAEDPTWLDTLLSVEARLEKASAAVETGDLPGARKVLAPIRRAMGELRRRNDVTVHSDRMDEVSAVMGELWHYRHNPPDFASTEAMGRLAAKTAVLEYLLRRYSAAAPPELRDQPAFGRLVGDADAAMERLKRAIETKNRELLINTLRELRSLERLLFLRYG